jgi:hypothetical protein
MRIIVLCATLLCESFELAADQRGGVSLAGQWATGAGAEFALLENEGSVTVIPGTVQRPEGYGVLRKLGNGLLEGEVVMAAGCVVQLSLSESEAGMKLSGTGRISPKSSRRCRSSLTKDAKAGKPFPYTLLRR